MTHPNDSEVEVTGCNSCPMRNTDYEFGSHCNHDDGPSSADEDDRPAPADCPLRAGPVTLRLREGV